MGGDSYHPSLYTIKGLHWWNLGEKWIMLKECMPYKRNLGWETPSIWTYNLGKHETFSAQQNELYICLIWKKGNLWMQKSETLICSIWAKALGMNNTQRLGLAASLAFQVWLLQPSTHSKLKQFAIQSCCQFKPFLVHHASSCLYLCKCWAH